MRLLVMLSGVVLVCASAVGASGTVVEPVHLAWLSEPSHLLILGIGFVLLAHPLRQKPTSDE
jgi:hypothetical protein